LNKKKYVKYMKNAENIKYIGANNDYINQKIVKSIKYTKNTVDI